MDSYNLFGDDGSGMLEGLTDLGGSDTFPGASSSGVTGDNKDSSENSYRQPYNPASVAQEGTIQKLASFGGGGGGGISSGSQPVTNPTSGPPAPEYHEYGAYPPRPRVPQPPHASLHPPHHVHPSHSYPGYHPGPDPMYGMPEQPGMGDIWSGAPGANRYASMAPGYRHGYEHQQKMHQYPPQQGPGGLANLQPQNGPYLPRQPHFSQPTSQQLYGQQQVRQNYPNYTQMQPPPSARISQHPTYHQQMEVNPHQYGLPPHGPQSHSAITQHQSHQSMTGHTTGLTPGMQSHPNVHLHHVGPNPLHHVGRQTSASGPTGPSSHSVPSQLPYGTPHHMSYQPHQVQHPLDVNVSNQFNPAKPAGLDSASPQYRPPFPQLSPQMSPRAQMSPRQQTQAQLSPRPVMSPVKGPSASPHGPRNLVQSPVPPVPTATNSFTSQNTLQALEQMVLPGPEYPYQRNPSSPAVSNIVSSPSQWNQNKVAVPIGNAPPTENADVNVSTVETVASMQSKLEISKNIGPINPVPIASVAPSETKDSETRQTDTEKLSKENPTSPHLNYSQSQLNPSSGNDTQGISSDSNISAKNSPALDNSALSENASSVQQPRNKEEPVPILKDLEKPLELDTVPEQKIELKQLNQDNCNQNINEKSGSLSSPLPPSSLANLGSSNMNDSIQHTNQKAQLMHSHPKSMPVSSQSSQFDNLSTMQPLIRPPIYQNIPSNIQHMSSNVSSGTSNTTIVSGPVNVSGPVSLPFQNVPISGPPGVSQSQPNHSIQHPNLTNTLPSTLAVSNQQALPLHAVSAINTSVPVSVPATISNTHTTILPPNSNLNIPSPQIGVPISMSVQNMHSNITSNVPIAIPPTLTNMPPNLPPNLPPNIPPNIPPNMGSNIPPNMPPNMSHGMNQNMMMMGPNAINHPNMPGIYATSHHQERMALQQQIQEIYCLPPSNENQEKVRCLQERLAILQQHEANDKCNGGPNCIMQSPVYGSKMVESPQVTSTTGRGRGKGPVKPRKPRAKKEKNVISQPLDQMPVSEDCVTAGTGLKINSEADQELGEDLSNLDSSVLSVDEVNGGKLKKQRGPRKNKERKPRQKQTKDPKLTEDKEKPVKERKKRQPKDPNTPRKKRNSKKELSEIQADTTSCYDFTDKDDVTLNESQLEGAQDSSKLDDSVTDFDDIPVSKIAIKDLLDEAEAKKEEEREDDSEFTCQKKRPGKKRPVASGSSSNRKVIGKRSSLGGKRKRRGGIVPDSDGEPDDMMSTPPPSPPPEADESLKRRSARNTQRKKYTDDVHLRLSDEEFNASTPKQDKEVKLDDSSIDIKDIVQQDLTAKKSYMYVTTTDDDSMIVQYVLACRMGKREFKNEPVLPEKVDEQDETKIKVEPLEEGESVKEEIKPEPETPETITENKTEITETPKMKLEVVEMQKTDVPIKEDPDKEPVMVDVEEYYVKYRNYSYLHCEWKTEEELYKGDKRIFSKIKRFKQKQAQQMNIFELFDDEPFNPDYIEVERILATSETEDPTNNSVFKHYLVKWKSLQYEDSTWELEEQVDIEKIDQFKIFNEIPPKEKWKYKKKPSADNWVQLKESPLYKGGNTLRPYQLEGLNWLLFSWHNNRNCILADEMGLGKTIQSLTFVNAVWETGIRGPFLIIAPLSTIPNWQREFEGWTDMNVIVYHGSQNSKGMIQEYEFYYKNEKGEPIKEITKFNVLITTFEIIVTDFQELKTFNWRICVIDEAHRLKNRNCKLLEGLRQLHLEHRVLLSGTPLQNNVNELFSLLNFLEPSQFSSSEAFLNEFGQLKSESEVVKLQALLKPMMLRRLKEDVEKTLAPKEETVIEVELTNIQKKYYRAILERNFSFLQKGTASAANIPNLMNTMMELRKCCIHPYLLNGAEDQIQFDYKQANGEDKEAYYKALIQSSGKMVLVDKLLPKLKAGGHRVLIFSQMVRCLDILEDYLLFRKYPFERIDGRIRGNLRQESIDRFSKPDSDKFVFLLCTKAGGLGINLTAADTVIIYDSDWNPQNDLQAQARCHRIGQQKMVKIYRLICRNTYEREMFDKASLKLGLDKAILQSMNTTQGKETSIKQLSKKEIEDLLKKGAYGAVMDEDNAGDKFCEEDIEMILARRTLVIQMASEKGSTFSKASFASTDQRSDIDIRDPDFWNKWAKKAEIDTTEKKEDEDLIVTEPRKRTSIKRYGHDDGNMEMSDMEVTPDSDDDEEGMGLRSKKKKDKLGRKGRKYASDDYIPRHEGVPIPDEDVVYGSWTRSECFKIERGLLTFGWGRWDEIVDKNQFRKGWTMPVIEDCARIIVLFCLRHYKGDEKIRNFIWDLIEPCENGEVTISRNHSGLHNPVPRGRNAKKKNRPKDIPKPSDTQKWEDPNHWCSTEKYDCGTYLESSYKKHLIRHANKVLLRVRMMYYIKHEVIGDYSTQIEHGTHASLLGMRVPRGVDSAPPRLWWDTECDVSLLVGTYIHGYENYLAMRSDPQLCFVDKLGPPDDAECTDIKSEERKVRGSGGVDEDCTDDVSSGAGATSPAASLRGDDDPSAAHLWPSMQDLNTRLRRLITAYQRNYKREELKMQQRAKMERREQLARDEAAQWRWSRADEEAFRRTVASYGVEFDPATKSLRWSRFRSLARLDNKPDDALTDYLKAFMAMCKRQCGLSVGEAELPTRADLKAEPIGEERAIATLERIDLLRVLREEVASHSALEARLALCERSGDAPPWWHGPAHDKLLVRAVCKNGLGDTFNKIFCDPKLPFAESAAKWYTRQKPAATKKEAEEEENEGESPRRALRSRRGNEDGDALSELESLAKLARAEPALSPDWWFTERALETRLHHIAHTVQKCEWPSGSGGKPVDPKRHIAIDVETERAKLQALLASPGARDDASSDSGSRRSTPAPPPPPAHQRAAAPPAPSPAPPAAAPHDLSAPLDLSDAPRRQDDPDPRAKLAKRKTPPAPEPVVGKEKKRKKLDEIVLGLSAAKGRSSTGGGGGGGAGPPPGIPADVTVTPAAPPAAPAPPAHKPFSVTVTSVPSPSPHKEPASFLQQSLEQAKGPKPAPPKPYAHDAKVSKWLAEATATAARRPAPRLAPDEPVPVVHRVTGKRLTGHKAPQLKHLAQWIADNPMYDIDSKWTDSIKEHVKLPSDARSPRQPPPPPPAAPPERKKGRPPSLDASAAALSSQHLGSLNPALLASLSGLGAFDPKTLAATLSNLAGFDPKLLSGFDPKLLASLGSFDPKNNPLLSSFGSVPNLLGGNIFANLAGLGLPGFSSMDMNSLAGTSSASDKSKSRKPSESASTSTSKSGSANSQFPFVFPNPNMLYPQLGLSGLNPFGMHSGLSSSYDALGLLGNNLGGGSSSGQHSSSRGKSGSSRASATPSPSPQRSSLKHASSSAASASAAAAAASAAQLPQILMPPDPYLLESLSKQSLSYDALLRQQEKRMRDADAHEAATDLSKTEKKKTQYDSLRPQMPPEFAAVQEKLLRGDKKDIDISKMLLEQMASGALSASLVSSSEAKKAKDMLEKEANEKSTKSSDFMARALSSNDSASISVAHKRTHDDMVSGPENLTLQSSETNPTKKVKETNSPDRLSGIDKRHEPPSHTGEMDLEDLIAPSTVIKTGMKPSDFDTNISRNLSDHFALSSAEYEKDGNNIAHDENLSSNNEVLQLTTTSNKQDDGKDDDVCLDDGNNDDPTSSETGRKGIKKKTRKSSEESAASGTRRELRSSSGRQSTESI